MAEISQDARQPMIKSLYVENFRCFHKINLEDLGRFNIVVGKNSAGKTALLESLVLPAGRHDLVFRLRAHRGLMQPPLMASKAVYEALWRDLFFRFSQNATITISLKGTAENSRTLRVFYNPQNEAPLLIGFQTKDGGAATPKTEPWAIVPLTFETKVGIQTYPNTAVLDTSNPNPNVIGLRIVGTQPPAAPIGFLPTLAAYNLQQQFSDIDVKNQKGGLIAALKEVFPVIEDLSLQSTAGGMSDVYCTVAALPEKIPVALLSTGIHRFLAVLISIATTANGIILVDEIENGIFHENFEKAWRGIVRFCKQYNVQLFASTHSKECLEALAPLLAEDQDEFRLLRTEALEDGNHSVRIFKGKDFESALKTGVDPRQVN
jgi:predicted ATPase